MKKGVGHAGATVIPANTATMAAAAADVASVSLATANCADHSGYPQPQRQHGYELIKEIETLTQGNYSPSPGVIYPTLDLLQDQGLISVEYDNGRKKILISEEGKQLHAENQEHLAHIQERLQARMVGCELRRDPQMKRALENFKAVLDLKVNQQASSAAQLKQIIGIIDRAAMEISQLD